MSYSCHVNSGAMSRLVTHTPNLVDAVTGSSQGSAQTISIRNLVISRGARRSRATRSSHGVRLPGAPVRLVNAPSSASASAGSS